MDPRILSAAHIRGGLAWRLIEYAPGVRQAPHRHDRGSLTLVLRGTLLERSAAGHDRAAALSVIAKSPGFEHADDFGEAGALTLQVELPRRWAGPLPAMASAAWDHAGPACRVLLRLVDSLVFPAEAAPHRMELLVREALALLPARNRSGARAPSWLDTAREALESESVSIATLARRAGVHPVYLGRRFRDRFGVGPAAYRRRMQVFRAAQGLLGAPAPLADVALEAGFCDQPHMNHAVRAATGLTPGALRRIARAVDARLPGAA